MIKRFLKTKNAKHYVNIVILYKILKISLIRDSKRYIFCNDRFTHITAGHSWVWDENSIGGGM